jgi:UPF0755 protein
VFQSLFLLLVVGTIGAASLAYVGYARYAAEGPLEQAKIFEVGKGLGAPEIAAELQANGIISDTRVFSAAALVTGSRGRLKAGEYEFPARASMSDVMNIIASGKAILYKLTVPEGWTTEMVLHRVRENDVLMGELTLKPNEGEVLPETYLFKRGKTRDELVAEMVEAQSKLLEELWTARGSNVAVKSARDAVILASIVEKETGVAEERPRVAAVFSNRLKKNMKLQSDPTIIYGIAGGKGKLDRPLSKADIADKTAYNTYQITATRSHRNCRQAIEAASIRRRECALFRCRWHRWPRFRRPAEHNANVQKRRGIESNGIS